MANIFSPSSDIQALDDEYFLPASDFFRKHKGEALTYGEISLATHLAELWPNDTDPGSYITEKIRLSTPLVSADMDTVTESEMAIQMALNGGLWMIHSNLTPAEQLEEVKKVKNHVHGVIRTPVFVNPGQNIADILDLRKTDQLKFSTFPVLDDSWRLIGLLGAEAVKERYADKSVSEVMKTWEDMITMEESQLWDNPIKTADTFFTANIGITKLLIVDKNWNFKWLITEDDVFRITKEERSDIKPSRDDDHRLRTGATLHMIREGDGQLNTDTIIQNTWALVDAGVDIVAISTAHGFSQWVSDMVKIVRSQFWNLDIMAGNVTSAQWVEYLKNAGANIIKVWQWPWSICTTRTQTGVGIPQATAVHICSEAAKILWWVKVLADGGITASWDMVKAFAIGGNAVMLGGLLAWCKEAPGEIYEMNGEVFKAYRWMGSIEAMQRWSAARYGHSTADSARKLAPEWIPAAKKYIGPVADTLQTFRASIQSGYWYHWAPDIETLQERARFVKMNDAWVKESAPHDVIAVNKQ